MGTTKDAKSAKGDPWGASLLCAAALLLAPALHAAPAPGAWSTAPLTSDALPAQLDAIAKVEASLPPPAAKTLFMQRLLLKIRAGAPMTEWRPEMAKFAAATGEDPVTAGLRDLALAWEARARIAEMDVALRKFYRKQVRFPDTLDLVDADIPASAKKDPWNETWTYQPKIPHGFSAKMNKQRYLLTPKRYTVFRDADDANQEEPLKHVWKITPKDTGGQKLLEIRTPATSLVTQVGGHIEDCTLLFIGDGWALFTDTERLFTVNF